MRTVRAAGFQPLEPPLRDGSTYVLRATDFRGILMHVVLDARTGTIRDVRRIAPAGPGPYGMMAPPYAPGPYGPPPYGPPPYEPPYGQVPYGPPPYGSAAEYGARGPLTGREEGLPYPDSAPIGARQPASRRLHALPLPRPRPALTSPKGEPEPVADGGTPSGSDAASATPAAPLDAPAGNKTPVSPPIND